MILLARENQYYAKRKLIFIHLIKFASSTERSCASASRHLINFTTTQYISKGFRKLKSVIVCGTVVQTLSEVSSFPLLLSWISFTLCFQETKSKRFKLITWPIKERDIFVSLFVQYGILKMIQNTCKSSVRDKQCNTSSIAKCVPAKKFAIFFQRLSIKMYFFDQNMNMYGILNLHCKITRVVCPITFQVD